MPPPDADVRPARFLAVAWTFFLVAAVLGVALRGLTIWPFPAVRYSYVLHTHSHIAMLGWVFNAFFALAVYFFPGRNRSLRGTALFSFLQIAVAGMLFSYPFQGYGAVSIAFSTLHLAGSAIFAWHLWRHAEADPATRAALHISLVFLVFSALGPLALGPLAAAGLRDSPAYSLAIYFYLHCQYNGWFPFFLQAVLWRRAAQQGEPVPLAHARPLLLCLSAGAVLTFALSTLWLSPPAWVTGIALSGGLIQAAGFALFLRGLPKATTLFRSAAARRLALIAGGAYGVKLLLQIAGALPAFSALTNQRFLVIGFLHWMFLAVVTPLLIAWAIELGWIRWNRFAQVGTGALLAGAGLTEITLGYPTLAAWFDWPATGNINVLLLVAAIIMACGTLVVSFALTALRDVTPKSPSA